MLSPVETSSPFSQQVVIVGGGITGLSAAFYLQRQGVPYTLVERDNRLGGKIRTETVEHDGQFLVEAGPDSFVTQKPWATQLARDLGLEHRLMPTNQQRKTVYVLRGGRPTPMPEGMALVVPTDLSAFLRSPLLSLPGRVRVLLEPLVPRRRSPSDETLAQFIRRRLGREMLERLAEPLMAGIHNAECERQSLAATFPRFQALEQQHGSLIRSMRAQTRASRARGEQRPPAFLTLRGGVGELVEALATQLTGTVLLGRTATELRSDGTDGYQVRLDDGTTLSAGAVLLATSAPIAASLLEPLQPALAEQLRQTRYVSTATISLAFRAGDVARPLDGYGLVIPHAEGRRINAITMSSVKFSDRAPAGSALIRVFVGGSRNPAAMALDDAALEALARAELRDILGIDAPPLFTRIYRWNSANPQYDLGHLERVAALEAACPDGILLAGCAYGGVGIPDCVHQGKQAAERLGAHLNKAQTEPLLARS